MKIKCCYPNIQPTVNLYNFFNRICRLVCKKQAAYKMTLGQHIALIFNRRLSFHCNDQLLLNINYRLVVPHITYGVVFWGRSSSFIKNVYTPQTVFLRAVFKKPRGFLQKKLFKEKKIFGIFINKTIILLKFNLIQNDTNYSIKINQTIIIPTYNIHFFRNYPTYNILKPFNNVPKFIKEKTNLKTFKKTLSTFLYYKSYCKVKELLVKIQTKQVQKFLWFQLLKYKVERGVFFNL